MLACIGRPSVAASGRIAKSGAVLKFVSFPKARQLVSRRVCVRATAGQEGEDERATVPVTLHLRRHCNYGERFAVVGECEELGSWDTAKAVPMQWTEGDIWEAVVHLPAETPVDYKYIHKSEQGECLGWESGLHRIGKKEAASVSSMAGEPGGGGMHEEVPSRRSMTEVQPSEFPDIRDKAVPFASAPTSSASTTSTEESRQSIHEGSVRSMHPPEDTAHSVLAPEESRQSIHEPEQSRQGMSVADTPEAVASGTGAPPQPDINE